MTINPFGPKYAQKSQKDAQFQTCKYIISAFTLALQYAEANNLHVSAIRQQLEKTYPGEMFNAIDDITESVRAESVTVDSDSEEGSKFELRQSNAPTRGSVCGSESTDDPFIMPVNDDVVVEYVSESDSDSE